MKKVLSFVLVLAMILGSFSMAFAWTGQVTEETVTPFADAETSYVATALKYWGVLKGTGNGAELDKTLNRADMVVMMMRILGLEDVCKEKTATTFTDVPKTHWASGYIAMANSLGYADGSGKKFNPDQAVTADEAITFVLKALGYDATNLTGTWPLNYRMKASDLGILDNCKVGSDTITRGDVFQLIYNAIENENELVKWNSKTDEWKEQGATFASRLNVDADEFHVSDEGVYTVDELEEISTYYDYTAYAGKYVTFVHDDDCYILGVNSVSGTAIEGYVLSSSAFKAVDGTEYKLADTTAAVAKINDAWTGVEQNIAAIASTTAVTLTVDYNAKKATTIDYVYCVEYWTPKAQATAMVTKTQAASFAALGYATVASIANSSLNYVFAVTPTAVSGVYEALPVVVEGAVTDLKDIEENDILEIYTEVANTANNSVISKVVVTRNTVEGGIAKKTLNSAGVATVVVNGTSLKGANETAKTALANATVSTAATKVFYLDKDGKVVSFAAVAGTTETAKTNDKYDSYAYVLGTNVKKVAAKAATLDSEAVAEHYEYEIRLLPLGASEAVDITISKGAVSMGALVVNDTDEVVYAGYGFDHATIGAILDETAANTTLYGITVENVSWEAIKTSVAALDRADQIASAEAFLATGTAFTTQAAYSWDAEFVAGQLVAYKENADDVIVELRAFGDEAEVTNNLNKYGKVAFNARSLDKYLIASDVVVVNKVEKNFVVTSAASYKNIELSTLVGKTYEVNEVAYMLNADNKVAYIIVDGNALEDSTKDYVSMAAIVNKYVEGTKTYVTFLTFEGEELTLDENSNTVTFSTETSKKFYAVDIVGDKLNVALGTALTAGVYCSSTAAVTVETDRYLISTSSAVTVKEDGTAKTGRTELYEVTLDEDVVYLAYNATSGKFVVTDADAFDDYTEFEAYAIGGTMYNVIVLYGKITK